MTKMIRKWVIDSEREAGHIEFSFSKEDKEFLKEELLREFEPERINDFIAYLELICMRWKYLTFYVDTKYNREKLRSIRENLEITLKDLSHLQNRIIALVPEQTFDDFHDIDTIPEIGSAFDPRNAPWRKDVDKAQNVLSKILKNIVDSEDKLNKIKPHKGRPPSYNEGFIREISALFYSCFGMPSSTKEKPFFVVVATVLNALDLPAEDPSRPVKKAIRWLKENKDIRDLQIQYPPLPK